MLVTLRAKILTSERVFQNVFILRRPSRIANFADIIKITTAFNNATFNDSNKLKRIRNYLLKY